ncbi:MAG TPA: ATP-dependent RNA helicase HrpA [Gammaproteobacteria bacterium]|nr:ATP-dependent RNA helicase HrpA [Gammaproteobacteria bacterium]
MSTEPSATTPTLDAIARSLDDALGRDRHGLRRRLSRLRRAAKQGQPKAGAVRALAADVEASCQRREARRAAVPPIRYPEALPVCERREEIAAAIRDHQVVVVCGETGSGKTTQLPKICLELGRGVGGYIGHTQPRRLAARSVCARIAEELGAGRDARANSGGAVGYKVRFHDTVGEGAYIKLMTDGILLAEVQGDRFLDQYDTLIIDEAHERSLNIDFLLGYLKDLLPRRPDLKLIITSATIDPERFSRHFGDAPVIEVSGRTYPVDIRYRPVRGEDEDERDRDLQQAILDAVDEVCAIGPGDVLIFLPGQREIRDTAEALRKHHPPHTEILPLYSRLSAAEQDRVFHPHGGRRIVLATNVAETSLTVPGIRYVIDPGYARLNRYSYRSKVQRLPVEKISQASANQRAGRCGRVSAGVCIRLYSEEDFGAREAFTPPEILRTNLAGVILQMQALGLGAVERFPFVEAPDTRHVNDGYRLLQELGAVDERRHITAIGRELARLPIDVRLGRMLLAAREERCLAEVLIIVSALAVQDPRERPLEAQAQADAAHEAFADEHSDFVSYLKLWTFYQEQKRHLSHRKLRALCRERFLSYLRLREWEDIHRQLAAQLSGMGMTINRTPVEGDEGYAAIHRALLHGLLGNVAMRRDARSHLGARNLQLQVHPGSALAKKPPKWLVAAELVETTRLYARTVARIEPAWIEPVAGHLLKRSYSEPHWERRAGRVAAFERATLYGLPVVARRKVNYGPIDPVAARELFIRGALVEGDFQTRGGFLVHNRALLEEVQGLEHKARRRDIVVDEDTLYAFYDRRLPAEVYDGVRFERWRKQAEAQTPNLLYLRREDLLRKDARAVSGERFPDTLALGDAVLALHYHFEPGHAEDGVTVDVPLPVLNQLSAANLDWLVPGLLMDKAVALIKSLPKSLRRNFVPAPDFAAAALEGATSRERRLTEVLGEVLERMTGVAVPAEAWCVEELPEHLHMRVRVIDAQGGELASGRDLDVLQARWGERARAAFESEASADTNAGRGAERAAPGHDGITKWDFGTLETAVSVERGGLTLQAYPALEDRGKSVTLRLLDSAEQARAMTRGGLRRLYMLALADKVKYLRRNLREIDTMCLQFSAVGRCEALKDDLIACAFDRVFLDEHTWPRTGAEFAARVEAGRGRVIEVADGIAAQAGAALAAYHDVAKRVRGSIPPSWMHAVKDIREQLSGLVYPGFVSATPPAQLAHLARYLHAISRRLDKLDRNPARDREQMLVLRPLWEAYRQRAQAAEGTGIAGAGASGDSALAQFHWLLEEWRVSLFAQELKTAQPVSEQRLRQAWQALSGT